MVAVAEELARAGGLEGTAERRRMVRRAVERPICRRGTGVAAAGRAGDRVAVLVEKGELVAERGGHRVRAGKPVVLQAQMIDELRAGAVAAALDLRRVAVDMLLLEVADVEIPQHRPGVAQGVFAAQPGEAQFVVGGLRGGKERAVVQPQQLDRGRRGNPERGRGRDGEQMQLGSVALPAEIAVEADDVGRRFEAPAILVHPLRGNIDGGVAEPGAVLRVAAEMPERTALGVGFVALIAEPVLHLEADSAAQRVQAEYRIVGPQIGARDRIGRDQVPVHRVAERLVEPDAVEINRHALRGAL